MYQLKNKAKRDNCVFLLKGLLIFLLISYFFLCPVKADAALYSTEANPYFTNFQFTLFPILTNQFDNLRLKSYGSNNLNVTNSFSNFNTNYNWNGFSQKNGFLNLNNSLELNNATNIYEMDPLNNLYKQFDLCISGRSSGMSTLQPYSIADFSFNNDPLTISLVNNLYNLNGSIQDVYRSILLFLSPTKDNDSQGQNDNQGQANTETNIPQPTTEGRYLARLKPVTDCDDLLAQLKEDAINKMEEQIDSYIESVVECGGYCNTYRYEYWPPVPYYYSSYSLPILTSSYGSASSVQTLSITDSSPPAFAPDIESTSLPESASDYSTTNVQVLGVDEADFIKNDGSYIYILSNDKFIIIDAWPPEVANIISTVEIEGTAKKLFVANDRALIYSSLDYLDGRSATSGNDYECTHGYNCDFIGDSRKLKITIFDISDRSDPELVREIRFEGSYINSRLVGSAVYTVVYSPAYFSPEIRYLPDLYEQCSWPGWWYDDIYYSRYYIPIYFPPGEPPTGQPTLQELLDAFEELKEENRKIIEYSTIEDWLPNIQDIIYGPGGTVIDDRVLYDCASFYDTDNLDNKSFLTIISMDIDDTEELNQQTIFGAPGAVYASSEALYISSRQKYVSGLRWYYDDSWEIQEASTVHKFRLQNDPPDAEYVCSGVVEGKVLNQFSMDEYNGFLRIATTTGHVPSPDVHSTLSVLKEDPDELKVVGRVDNIAPNEDIRSVRFNGKKGFIVTFKKTDPLFGFNLENPENPYIEGELKIPGFSTYIHLMDDDHLLTIGYDSDDQGSFAWFQGIMLQIFDVSNMADLKLMHKEVIGTRGSTSEAATNHLAFNYFAPKNLLAIPITICVGGSGGSYGTDMTFSGLKIYDVSLEYGFLELGGISHMEPNCENCQSMCRNWWTDSHSVVQRSIFMDDYVFSVAMDKIVINHLDHLGDDINVVSLPET